MCYEYLQMQADHDKNQWKVVMWDAFESAHTHTHM